MTDEQTQHTQQTPPTPNGGPRVIADRYAVLGELGRGGMGIVWRAEDRVIGRIVAVKELRLPDVAEEAGVFQERVLREVRTGGSINDPAVVTVYDVVVDNAATFIVMELVDAPTLSDLVRRNGPLPAHQVASIGEQVLAALSAAHRSGIVHRDVKPGNIMVASTGRVKLTDFGIAQAVDDPRLTTSGMLVGSPAFMAPERVAGREALPASDLWSLGATLFFAVEGIVAHERTSTAATLHAIMNEVPYLTHAQGPLASAIMGLLISTPEARLSGDQSRGLLQMAAAGHGRSTPPAGNQTAVQPGGQPINPTMVGGHTMLGRPPLPGHAGQYQPPRGKGRRTAMIIGGVAAGVALLVGGFFAGKPFWAPPGSDSMLASFSYGAPGANVGDLNRSSSYDCGNTPLDDGKTLTDDNWNDCAKTHTFEVYSDIVAVGEESPSSSSSDPKPVTEYPGEDELKAFAEAKCTLVFNSSVVPADQRERLQYRALVPAQALWEKRPTSDYNYFNRRVMCVLQDASGAPLTGRIAKEST